LLFHYYYILKHREETRGFNVVADDPNGVTCLVLDRQTYNQYFNDPQSTLKRHESIKMYKRAQTQHLNLEDEEELDLVDIRLSEFEILGTLGVGGFGRVELVKNTRDSRTYALKILKKQLVVETKQQDHVLNERNIIMDARSNFICRLYKTFKDKKVTATTKFIYFFKIKFYLIKKVFVHAM
jgi:cGMP-dependent protein kinase